MGVGVDMQAAALLAVRAVRQVDSGDECDVTTLGLLPWQLHLIYQTLDLLTQRNPTVHARAQATHLALTPFLVYRYFAATQWTKKYDGKPIDAAIVGAVSWRLSFGVPTLHPPQFAHLIHAGLGYTGGYDQHGRVILYMKVNRAGKKSESNQTYLNLLMYTLERADRFCADRQAGASGEFVVVIDLEGFSLSRGLPFSVIQEFFSHTAHYPFRLGAIYLVNSNTGFGALWGIVKGFLPKRLEKQTFMLSKATAARTICEHLGRECVERAYGGTLPEGPGDVQLYLSQGYWQQQGGERDGDGLRRA
jgi:hypothetical protein